MTPSEFPDLRALLIRLGTAMTRAGDSVDDIEARLLRVARVNGVVDVQVIVLPTVLLIQTARGAEGRVELSRSSGARMRLDQIEAVYRVLGRAERGDVTPAEALAQLDAVDRLRPTYPWPARVIGHAIQAAGLSLLLQPSWTVFAACAGLGLGVGLVRMVSRPSLELILPVLTSFGVALVVFGVAKRVPDADNPLRTLIPPLVTFLPGAVLVIGTVELAANQVVAGASRLVYGSLQLVLLAFGIAAAAALVDTPDVLRDREFSELGWWAPWLGVLIFGVGVVLYLAASPRSFLWIIGVLYVTYAAQRVGDELFGGELSGFVGALVMTPLVFTIARLQAGPPSMVTFLPAFWLLVPGAAGLIGVAELFGSTGGVAGSELTAVLSSIVAIAVGVLIGTAAYRAATSGWWRTLRTTER